MKAKGTVFFLTAIVTISILGCPRGSDEVSVTITPFAQTAAGEFEAQESFSGINGLEANVPRGYIRLAFDGPRRGETILTYVVQGRDLEQRVEEIVIDENGRTTISSMEKTGPEDIALLLAGLGVLGVGSNILRYGAIATAVTIGGFVSAVNGTADVYLLNILNSQETEWSINVPFGPSVLECHVIQETSAGEFEYVFFPQSGYDADGDGLDDTWERVFFGNLNETWGGDYDQDGVLNGEEMIYGLYPVLLDTDRDGCSDWNELFGSCDQDDFVENPAAFITANVIWTANEQSVYIDLHDAAWDPRNVIVDWPDGETPKTIGINISYNSQLTPIEEYQANYVPGTPTVVNLADIADQIPSGVTELELRFFAMHPMYANPADAKNRFWLRADKVVGAINGVVNPNGMSVSGGTPLVEETDSQNNGLGYFVIKIGEEPITYTLTTAVSPAGKGTVTGSGSYTAGTSVTVTATPITGWQFSHWTGGLSGSTNPTTLVMPSANTTVTAVFVEIPAEEGQIVVDLTWVNSTLSFSAKVVGGEYPANGFIGIASETGISSVGLEIYHLTGGAPWIERQTFAFTDWAVVGTVTKFRGGVLRFEVVANASGGYGDISKMTVRLNGTAVPRVTNSDNKTAFQVTLN